LLLLIVPSVFAAHNLNKRSNGYGDELIVPEETHVEVQAEPRQQYAEEEVSVVDVAPASGYDDQPTQTVEVERSGYRFKRSNAYGDEFIVPEEPQLHEVVNSEHKPAYGEEEVAIFNSEPYGDIQTHPTLNALPVQDSGYRLKRNVRVIRGNEYGDEQIVPEVTVEDTPAARSDYAESAPIVAEVQQYEPVVASSAAVEHQVERSGYRTKRSNAYGDEQIVPEVTVEDTPAARSDYAESAPVVAEMQQYEPVPAAAAAVEQVVERSGYRSKRNAYGDELIVPSTVLQTAPVAPVAELASSVVDQSYVGQVVAARPAISPTHIVGAAPPHYILSEQSMSYGDEAVVPAQVPVIPVHHLRYAELPLTYGSLFAARPYPKAPMVVSSGYRTAKRARFAKRRLH
ncbi:hypothetical protein PENTCL1PPCAC_17480, partial [Pristionchus entomophagus]